MNIISKYSLAEELVNPDGFLGFAKKGQIIDI